MFFCLVVFYFADVVSKVVFTGEFHGRIPICYFLTSILEFLYRIWVRCFFVAIFGSRGSFSIFVFFNCIYNFGDIQAPWWNLLRLLRLMPLCRRWTEVAWKRYKTRLNRALRLLDVSLMLLDAFWTPLGRLLDALDALCLRPTTKYMTLGPKFYTKLVSSITRRRMNENQWFFGESSQNCA